VLAAGFAMALFSAALAVAVHTGRFGPGADATGGQPAAMGSSAAPAVMRIIDAGLVESARPELSGRQVAEDAGGPARPEPGGWATGQPSAHDGHDLDTAPGPVRLGAGAIGGGAVGGSDHSDGNGGQDTLPAAAATLTGLASAGGIGDSIPYRADTLSTVESTWAGLPGIGGGVEGGEYGADTAPLASLALAAVAGATAPLGAGHARQLGFDSVAGEIEQVEVPEPATLGMLALGLAGLGLVRRRRGGACPQ